MAKDEKLRQAIRNLYDEYSRAELPYFVTERLKRLMKTNSIKVNEQLKEVSAG